MLPRHAARATVLDLPAEHQDTVFDRGHDGEVGRAVHEVGVTKVEDVSARSVPLSVSYFHIVSLLTATRTLTGPLTTTVSPNRRGATRPIH